MARTPKNTPAPATTKRGAKTPEAAAEPKRSAQIRQAFTLTRQRDSKLVPYMALAFVVTVGICEAIGFGLGGWIVWTVFGVIFGVLAAFIVFGQRAQRAMFAEIDGQPGAAVAVISNMRGDWRVTPNVDATRSMDVLHRVVGKPGVILIGEGSTERLAPLVARQQK